ESQKNPATATSQTSLSLFLTFIKNHRISPALQAAIDTAATRFQRPKSISASATVSASNPNSATNVIANVRLLGCLIIAALPPDTAAGTRRPTRYRRSANTGRRSPPASPDRQAAHHGRLARPTSVKSPAQSPCAARAAQS